MKIVSLLAMAALCGALVSCADVFTKDDVRAVGGKLLQGGLAIGVNYLAGNPVKTEEAVKALGTELLTDVSKRVQFNLVKGEEADPKAILALAKAEALNGLEEAPVSPEVKLTAALAIQAAADAAAAKLDPPPEPASPLAPAF